MTMKWRLGMTMKWRLGVTMKVAARNDKRRRRRTNEPVRWQESSAFVRLNRFES